MNGMKLLTIDFPFPGPFGDELTAICRGLAGDIAQEPGLLWKIWTENEESKRAGGVYLFADKAAAAAYLTKQSARLEGMGVSGIRAEIFDVNAALTEINKGPVTGA